MACMLAFNPRLLNFIPKIPKIIPPAQVPSYPVMDLSILRLTLHEGHKSPERLNVPKEVADGGCVNKLGHLGSTGRCSVIQLL